MEGIGDALKIPADEVEVQTLKKTYVILTDVFVTTVLSIWCKPILSCHKVKTSVTQYV